MSHKSESIPFVNWSLDWERVMRDIFGVLPKADGPGLRFNGMFFGPGNNLPGKDEVSTR